MTGTPEQQNVLVTGATGFIGEAMVAALVRSGRRVVATGRRSRPDWLDPESPYRPADLAADDLGPLMSGVTHVVHLAGASSSLSDQAEMERANVVGTRRTADAARRAGVVRFVHMSSTSVYGEELALPSPVSEDVVPLPSRGYGKAKLGAENAAREVGARGLETVVLRPVTVYGPGAVKLLASVILDVAVERFLGLDSVVVPAPAIEQRLLHIDDLVAATIHLVAASGVGGRTFNVASGTFPTSYEVAAAVAGAFDVPFEVVDDAECGPTFEERRSAHSRMVDAGMQDRILLTPDRFRFMRKANRNNRVSIEALLATGFAPAETDLHHAVGRSVGWYRERRWIV